MNSIHLHLERKLSVVGVVDVGEEDANNILLYLDLDDGELQPPVIGNICAQCEIMKSHLLHIPLNKNLLRVDV